MKSTLKILRLISECIQYDHPIVLDIRYRFHLLVCDLSGSDPWPTRGKWEEIVRGDQYTLRNFLQMLRDFRFRKRIIAVLEIEVARLKEQQE